MEKKEIPYWMSFAHAENFTGRRKMDFLIEAVFTKDISLVDALKDFELDQTVGFSFSEKEKKGLTESIGELANYSFLAEELLNRGIKVISIFDEDYPKTLKSNLKKSAPVLVYARGNTNLLKTDCIAIVGSRKSSSLSLEFTDRLAKKAVNKQQTIVSGFAKGIDRQALDSAIKYKGHSIIVLPQGINTYRSKTYYADIIRGDVLVISTYHPKAPWSIGLAMDRNNTIYGMADEIYAAESDAKGGTWTGVRDGLKKGRKVFVRMPGTNEKNANLQLIQEGALPVDVNGEVMRSQKNYQVFTETDLFTENSPKIESKTLTKDELINKVIEELNSRNRDMTIAMIIKRFNVEESVDKVRDWLKKSNQLENRKVNGKLFFNLPGRFTVNSELFKS